MYTSICWYLRILPVLHRPEVVDIVEKHAVCQRDYRMCDIALNFDVAFLLSVSIY